jgi:hypothetical protein
MVEYAPVNAVSDESRQHAGRSAADQVAPADATQDLRAPDQVAAVAATQDLRAPDQSTSAPSVPASPVEATDAVSTSGGGLSTMWIVLICLGGVAALAAAG